MKYSKAFNRDYEFYLKNKERFSFAGVRVDIAHECSGVSAKENFYRIDTRGEKNVTTNEPELLNEILRCKKSINLHIKMWVEGYEDMLESVEYYMSLFVVHLHLGSKSLFGNNYGESLRENNTHLQTIAIW